MTIQHFIDKTTIIPSAVVSQVCHNLPENRLRWFTNHVENRLLAMWPKYRYRFLGLGGRDFVYMWVEHWLTAYELDFDRYESQHGATV